MKRWLISLLLLGCEEPLKEAQLLQEPRILGVRAAAPGDRASLEPGQSAELDVLLAGPEGTLDARLAYQLCLASDSHRGVPYCEEAPFAEGHVELNGSVILASIPASIPGHARLALLGVACAESDPLLSENPLDWRCAGDTPLGFSLDLRPSTPDFDNANPRLTELEVTIDGTDIPIDGVRARASCDLASSVVPSVVADVAHQVVITLGDGVREPGEALQLSHFSTHGAFERPYSFVTAEQPGVTSLEWTAPAVGTAVKQYLVVRDGRGGVSWASWSVCAR